MAGAEPNAADRTSAKLADKVLLDSGEILDEQQRDPSFQPSPHGWGRTLGESAAFGDGHTRIQLCVLLPMPYYCDH